MIMAVSVVMRWPNTFRATTMAERQNVAVDIPTTTSPLLAVAFRSKSVVIYLALTATTPVATLLRPTASAVSTPLVVPLAIPVTTGASTVAIRAKSRPLVRGALTVTVDATVVPVAALQSILAFIPATYTLRWVTKTPRALAL